MNKHFICRITIIRARCDTLFCKGPPFRCSQVVSIVWLVRPDCDLLLISVSSLWRCSSSNDDDDNDDGWQSKFIIIF